MSRIAVCVSFLAPIFLCLYTTYAAPRPYYISIDDHEHDYYYNGRLFYHGLSGRVAIHHPGTPIQYLASLLLSVHGDRPDEAQRFFDLAYLVAAVLAATSIAAFVAAVVARYPIGIVTLAWASIVAWPPFLMYLNYFGCKSFIVAFGLPTLVLFWSSLEDGQRPSRAKLFLCGVGLGLSLATQLTFVPVAAALFAGAAVHVLGSAGGWGRRSATLACLPLGAALSFLIFTAPIARRLPHLVMQTLGRNDVRPGGDALGALWRVFAVLVRQDLPLALTIVAAAGAFALVSVAYARRRLRATQSGAADGDAGEDRFDYAAAGVFLLLMVLAFAYALASSTRKLGLKVAGDVLVNASPPALALPFLVLYCYRLRGVFGARGARRAATTQVWAALVGVVVVAWAVTSTLEQRRDLIREQGARIDALTARLGAIVPNGGRIAFWDGSPGAWLGAPSFHFWGSYRWAGGYFDDALLRLYPRYTHFQLREVERIVLRERGTAGARRPVRAEASRAPVAGVGSEPRDRPRSAAAQTMVLGEDKGVGVSLLAFPVEETFELRKAEFPELVALARTRLGVGKIWTESIGGTDWMFVDVPGTDRAGDAHGAGSEAVRRAASSEERRESASPR